MPAVKTPFLANALLNHVLRNGLYVPPVAVYLALTLTTPTPTTPGVEVPSGPTAYTRQPIIFNPASNGTVTNSVSVTFSAALIAWGTIVGGEIWDLIGGGNRLYLAALGIPRVVNLGDQIIFAPGTILVREI
jgi:hypothetical protein